MKKRDTKKLKREYLNRLLKYEHKLLTKLVTSKVKET
jgi:hypothetical protein